MRLLGLSLSLLLSVSMASACAGEEERPNGPGGGVGGTGGTGGAGGGTGGGLGTGDCETSPLTYDNFAELFLLDYCVRCHSTDVEAADRNGAPGSVNFNDQDLATTFASRISARAGNGSSMPPGGASPSDEERSDLAEWVNCGTP